MNRDWVAGQWKEFRGDVQERWGKLTNDDLDVIAGKRDQLLGKIQQLYGTTREQAERELDELWEKKHHAVS
ncbi:MAG: CsbD family protein [Gemmatimonadales bacterium]